MNRKKKYKDLKITVQVDKESERRQREVVFGDNNPKPLDFSLCDNSRPDFFKDLELLKNQIHLEIDKKEEVEVVKISELPKISLKSGKVSKAFQEALSKIPKKKCNFWPLPLGFVIGFEDRKGHYFRAQIVDQRSENETIGFLIDFEKEITIHRTDFLFVLPKNLLEFPPLTFVSTLNLDLEDFSFPIDSAFKEKSFAIRKSSGLRVSIGSFNFKGSPIETQDLPLKLVDQLPQKKPFLEKVEENTLISKVKKMAIQELRNHFEIVIEKEANSFLPDAYVPVKISKVENGILSLKVGSSEELVKCCIYDVILKDSSKDEEFKQFLEKQGNLFAKLKSPLLEDLKPILIDLVTEKYRISSSLTALNQFAVPYKVSFEDLMVPDLKDPKMALKYLRPLEFQDVILVTRHEERQRLEDEIKIMKPFLEEEDHIKTENSLLLCQLPKDPGLVCRVRVFSNDNFTTLDFFDYAEQVKLKNDDNQIKFFKYPLNLIRYPILTFGIKVYGIPHKKITDFEKVDDFFRSKGDFQINEVKNEARLEVTLKNDTFSDLEKMYLRSLEGHEILFRAKILAKGLYKGLLMESEKDLIWTMLMQEIEIMEEIMKDLTEAFSLAKGHGLLTSSFQPETLETCYLADLEGGFMSRVIVLGGVGGKLSLHYLDRGDVVTLDKSTSMFLPSPCSRHSYFLGKHQELTHLLRKCDISRIHALATPCALPKSNRIDTRDICDKVLSQDDFFAFKVVGSDFVGSFQVNVIQIV